MAARPSCPTPDDVRVWYASTEALGPGADRLAQVDAWLTPDERIRYARFRRTADRDMFLLGRMMTRRLVGDVLGRPARAWPWREGLRGRPEVDLPDCPVSFNIAHSGGLVACAIAVGTTVGVDVEARDRPALDHRLVARYCSPVERAAVEAAGPDGWRDAFLRFWTLKEAYLKARGLGLTVQLADLGFAVDDDQVSVTFSGTLAGADPRWRFTLVAPDTGHYLAVAADAADGRHRAFACQALPPTALTDPA